MTSKVSIHTMHLVPKESLDEFGYSTCISISCKYTYLHRDIRAECPLKHTNAVRSTTKLEVPQNVAMHVK